MGLRDLWFAAIGRPRAIEQEQMVVSNGLMASMVRPGQGGVYFLPVDEIIRRKGWTVYNDMLNDDQVKAVLAFKKILVVGRGFEFAPADPKNAQAKEVADFVTWCMNKINLPRVLWETCSALEYGYSLAELVWTRDQYEGKQVVCLEKIAYRDPKELYLSIDEHGNFMGVRQVSMGREVQLDPDKVFLYSHNKRFGNIYGDSDLRAAYRSWWAKKFIINFWNVFLERMGQPMMMMKYPTGASDTLKQTLQKILRNLASKTEVLVPSGVDVQLVEATRGGTATYNEALTYHDNSIARAMLLSSLMGLGGESNKSREANGTSQSIIHLQLIFDMADIISQDIAREFILQVVRQLVAFNYGEDQVDALMPQFVWQDYGKYQATLIADEIRQLHAAGIIEMDQTDVNYVRGLLGMKLRGPDDTPDEVIRPEPLPPPGNANAPPPAAKQGNTRADKGGSARTGDSTTDS
jgi:phage gp29-like protein